MRSFVQGGLGNEVVFERWSLSKGFNLYMKKTSPFPFPLFPNTWCLAIV